MYKCQHCGKTTAKKTPMVVRVVETRSVTYSPRPVWKASKEPASGLRKAQGKWVPGHEGYGYETVKELRICPPCDLTMT